MLVILVGKIEQHDSSSGEEQAENITYRENGPLLSQNTDPHLSPAILGNHPDGKSGTGNIRNAKSEAENRKHQKQEIGWHSKSTLLIEGRALTLILNYAMWNVGAPFFMAICLYCQPGTPSTRIVSS
ncbi:MAG: hypothetical protein E7813_16890 [Bradyrhizobium sp.]|nr:MAG: hypothetical protein E7813_16890 [Bradyrhizobium sp.]